MKYPKEQWSHRWWERDGHIDPKRKGLYPGQLDNHVDPDDVEDEIEECKE
jgi:hypothetical protein